MTGIVLTVKENSRRIGAGQKRRRGLMPARARKVLLLVAQARSQAPFSRGELLNEIEGRGVPASGLRDGFTTEGKKSIICRKKGVSSTKGDPCFQKKQPAKRNIGGS